MKNIIKRSTTIIIAIVIIINIISTPSVFAMMHEYANYDNYSKFIDTNPVFEAWHSNEFITIAPVFGTSIAYQMLEGLLISYGLNQQQSVPWPDIPHLEDAGRATAQHLWHVFNHPYAWN
ncbi:MAG: hypothetical protein FWE05_13705, partial [Defluviitaleaceae bacterium]|nr:hypothetical protein [Defluviitaleaceae bacterium]